MNFNIKKETAFDVAGIGSPLMDIIVDADDALIAELGLPKGGMMLVDENRSAEILGRIAALPAERVPGGSASNTLAGIATLGGRAVLIGSIGSDSTAEAYRVKNESAGVKSCLKAHDALTGHAITFITPDGERTFATHLGAAIRLEPSDVDEIIITSSKMLHVEGYLLEGGSPCEAALRAMSDAKASGVRISIDLADPGVVIRNKEAVSEIAREYADILFLNEQEAEAFTGKEGLAALADIQNYCEIAVMKIGARGSMVSHNGAVYEIPSYPVTVINTNGAGDNYAAGMLYGLVNGLGVEKSARIGSYAASRVVGVTGARLENSFSVENIE